MSTKNFIVAIELGSTKIRGIAGKKNPDGTMSVLALSEEDATQCIRKGVVYNIDKTSQAINNIIQRLRAQLKIGIKHVFVGIGGQSVLSQHNLLFCDMPGTEGGIVSQQLIVEMMDENRGTIYNDKEILDVFVQEYRADNLMQTDPVGIPCQHLEGNFLNILQSKRHYQNLIKSFANADVKIAELYLSPIALADVILTPTEKRSGCLLVDLGAETTTVVVYQKNIVRHVAVIPLGSNNITKDLCSLQLEEQDAEDLKIKYASAFTDEKDINPEETYKIARQSVLAVNVIDCVEARMEEIITNVWNQVPAEFAEKLLSGIVLTGGGAQMRNINVAFRNITNIEQVRIAKDTNEAFTPQPLVPSSFTHNTLVGLLAKGDQNCCADVAVQKSNADIFNQPEQVEQPEQTVAPQPTQASGPTFEIRPKEEPAKKEEEILSEEDRLIQEYRQQKEKREKEKENNSLGNKISRWIQALTNPEE